MECPKSDCSGELEWMQTLCEYKCEECGKTYNIIDLKRGGSI